MSRKTKYWCVGSSPYQTGVGGNNKLPIIEVMVGGKIWKGLIDTGCTKAIARTSVFGKKLQGTSLVTNFSGETTVCGDTGFLDIFVNRAQARVEAIEATELLVDIFG